MQPEHSEKFHITREVFPVSYETVSKRLEVLLRNEFDIVIMLGVAQKADKLRIETTGSPINSGEVQDIDGNVGPNCTAVRAPVPSSMNLQLLTNELTDAGVDFQLSDSAGSYLCNFSYYTALSIITSGSLATRCCFLHLPADEHTFKDRPGTTSYEILFGQVRTVFHSICRLEAQVKPAS